MPPALQAKLLHDGYPLDLTRPHYSRPEKFSPRLIQACLSYSWPGNLRQLENFVRRYLVLGDEELAMWNFG